LSGQFERRREAIEGVDQCLERAMVAKVVVEACQTCMMMDHASRTGDIEGAECVLRMMTGVTHAPRHDQVSMGGVGGRCMARYDVIDALDMVKHDQCR